MDRMWSSSGINPLEAVASMLFVPAGNQRLVDSALKRRTSAYVLDLEDAIPPDHKDLARDALGADLSSLKQSGALVGVRVNRGWHMMARDVSAAIAGGADFIMMPKVEFGYECKVLNDLVDEVLGARARDNHCFVLAQIETGQGVINLGDITSAAVSRLAGLMLGPEDLALDLRAVPTRSVLKGIAQQIVVAARAGGLVPVGFPGSIAEVNDLERYRSDIELAKDMGFGFAVAIHPNQLPVLHEVFLPSERELNWARSVIKENSASGGRPFMFEGKMVDNPVVRRAQRLVQLSQCATLQSHAEH
jgi:citrate lyase subunit beta/citryl-CoA lyase